MLNTPETWYRSHMYYRTIQCFLQEIWDPWWTFGSPSGAGGGDGRARANACVTKRSVRDIFREASRLQRSPDCSGFQATIFRAAGTVGPETKFIGISNNSCHFFSCRNLCGSDLERNETVLIPVIARTPAPVLGSKNFSMVLVPCLAAPDLLSVALVFLALLFSQLPLFPAVIVKVSSTGQRLVGIPLALSGLP
jgi:hypothetical protein